MRFHTVSVDQSEDLRRVLGHYPSGLTVVTGCEGGEPVGFTCQAFHGVSLEPPLVAFNVMQTSTTYPRIRQAGSFCVNVLAADQQAIAARFATSGADKWSGVARGESMAGNPIIEGSLAYLDCVLVAEHEVGDHRIVLGHVREMGHHDESSTPLLYFRGSYHHLGGEQAGLAPRASDRARSTIRP